jgi:hypothetical protein
MRGRFVVGDDWIEQVARQLCREAGMDPDEVIEAPSNTVLTHLEQMRLSRGGEQSERLSPAMVPRWRIFRAAASRHYFERCLPVTRATPDTRSAA